jgi:hypothetical protein
MRKCGSTLFRKDRKIEHIEFTAMLEVARQQPEPAKYLFVFLDAALPEEHTPEEAFLFSQGQGGQLLPVMNLAKDLDELTTFADLINDIPQKEQSWQIVLVACVSGENGKLPSDAEVDGPLQVLEHTIRIGGDISSYVAFDQDGEHIQFG